MTNLTENYVKIVTENRREEYIDDIVRISDDINNENYDDFMDLDLRITGVSYNTQDHHGYDDSMDGEPLFDLVVDEDDEDVPFSLYEYELEWV